MSPRGALPRPRPAARGARAAARGAAPLALDPQARPAAGAVADTKRGSAPIGCRWWGGGTYRLQAGPLAGCRRRPLPAAGEARATVSPDAGEAWRRDRPQATRGACSLRLHQPLRRQSYRSKRRFLSGAAFKTPVPLEETVEMNVAGRCRDARPFKMPASFGRGPFDRSKRRLRPIAARPTVQNAGSEKRDRRNERRDSPLGCLVVQSAGRNQ